MSGIKKPSELDAFQASLSMQVGLALLDLVAALKPEQEEARHKMRTQLQEALSNASADHWLHRDLLQQMLDEL